MSKTYAMNKPYIDDSLLDLFFEQARRYCQEASELIVGLNKEIKQEDLELLRHKFHWFVGAGGTCGLPRVSKYAKTAELLCEKIQSQEREINGKDISKWNEVLAKLRQELDRARPPLNEKT